MRSGSRRRATTETGADRPSVGELLARHPGLVFYVDDYLISTRYQEHLRSRFARFARSLHERGGASPGTGPEAIAAAIRRGVLRHVAAYAGLGEVAAFGELPVLGKADLRARWDRFLSSAYAPGECWTKTTTGTSGTPIPIAYAPEFYFELLLLSLPKIALRAGLADRLDARPVFCLSLNDKKQTAGVVIADPAGRTGPSVQVHVDERDPGSFDRAVELLERLEPVCLASKPSVLEQLCARLAARGRRPRVRLELVSSSGTALLPAVRARIAETFGAPVVDAYTMTEFGVIASECPRGALHVDPTAALVEVLDDAGDRVPAGQPGELVISSLANRAMPLVRYRTGDTGAATTGRCACGIDGTRIHGLGGKRIACFRLADGSAFSPTFFNDLFARFPWLREFQITQAAVDRFEVAVAIVPEADAGGAAAEVESEVERVRAYVAESLPGTPAVAVRIDDRLGEGKFQRYRSEVAA